LRCFDPFRTVGEHACCVALVLRSLGEAGLTPSQVIGSCFLLLPSNMIPLGCAGPLATMHCEPRQARKGAAAAMFLCAEVRLAQPF